MIYFVSNQQPLFNDKRFTYLSLDKCKEMLMQCNILQCDTETSGLNPHLMDVMTLQLGSDKYDFRIVIDCTTIPIEEFKDILESKMLLGHNLKFDLQFFYKHNIIPRKIYDTMIVEQFIFLGYPYIKVTPSEYYEKGYDFPYHIYTDPKTNITKYGISYALNAVAKRYLNIDIDKTVRGQIRYRGVDPEVIVYGAGDVMYLEKIMKMQMQICKSRNAVEGAKLECSSIPAIAYLEWCGIHLDANKWKAKIDADQLKKSKALEELNNFIINLGNTKFSYLDPQGDLFSGFSNKPECIVNWDSPKQVIEVAQYLGFDTSCVSKSTGEESDSVGKYLKAQKGINDKFLEVYFTFKEASKVCSSFGQGHLNAINPITGRIHTSWRAIGTVSGRMSCGDTNDPDTELAKYKKLPSSACIKPNLQQLPHDAETRSCFTASDGNLWLSADYSALEARLGADIYNETSMIKEFNEGSGDMHSLCAKMVFAEELKGIEVKDVKATRPDLRTKVKPIEFSQQFR